MEQGQELGPGGAECRREVLDVPDGCGEAGVQKEPSGCYVADGAAQRWGLCCGQNLGGDDGGRQLWDVEDSAVPTRLVSSSNRELTTSQAALLPFGQLCPQESSPYVRHRFAFLGACVGAGIGKKGAVHCTGDAQRTEVWGQVGTTVFRMGTGKEAP